MSETALAAMGDQQRLHSGLASDDAIDALVRRLVCAVGPQPFGERVWLEAADGRFPGVEARLALLRLHKQGWIGAYKKTWGEVVYAVPFERCVSVCARILADVWQAEGGQRRREAGREQAEAGRESGQAHTEAARPHVSYERDAVLDMLRLWRDIAAQPVVLTKRGLADKKRVKQWGALIAADSAALEEAFPALRQSEYPAAVALALHNGLRTNVLRRGNGRIVADSTAMEHWLARPNGELRRWLLGEWLRVCCPDDPVARMAAFAALSLSAPGRAAYGALRARWEREAGAAGHCAAADPARFRAVAAALEQLGWLQLERAHDEEAAIWVCGFAARGEATEAGASQTADAGQEADAGQAADAGQEADAGQAADAGQESDAGQVADAAQMGDAPDAVASATGPTGGAVCCVQSDMELLVFSDAPYRLHWRLLDWAELTSRDRLCIYKLTADSVASALERGLRLSDLFDELVRYASGGIPDNVRRTLFDWERRKRGIVVEQLAVLHIAEPSMHDEIASLPGMDAYLNEARLLAPRMYRVGDGDVRALRRLLDRYGYSFGSTGQKEAGDGAASIADVRTLGEHERDECDKHDASDAHGTAEATDGLLHDPFRFAVYDRYPLEEEGSRLFPGLNAVPPVWLRQYSSYHPSVKRQILRQAALWQCRVQIRLNGRDIQVVPQRKEEEPESYVAVVAGRTMPLDPQQFTEIQLIVPEVDGSIKYVLS